MKSKHLARDQEVFGAFRRLLLTLCFFFACGAVLGVVACGMTSTQDALLLREYIVQYEAACAEDTDVAASVLSVLSVYLRYPLAAFCFGLVAAGVLLLPVMLVLQGFSAAFSVMCFVTALGRDGLLLALITFGLRLLLVLPVTLLLAADSFRRALQLAGQRNGKRTQIQGGDRYLKLFLCMLLLLVGAVAELLVIPKLLQLALAGL